MGNTLIKILDSEVALMLKESGFSFMKEQINGTDVYVFQNTQELVNLLESSFSSKDTVLDKKLSF